MDRIDYAAWAKDRYTDQHENDVVFDALVKVGINQFSITQDTLIELEDKLFDIDKSSGSLLDIIGRIVGQDRVIQGGGEYFGFYQDFTALGFGEMNNPDSGGYWYSLSSTSNQPIILAKDDLYRRLIKARIIYNNNLATPETFLRVVSLLLNTTNVTLTENNQGEVAINIDKDETGVLTYYLSLIGTERNILPIPLGVNITLNIVGE